MVEILTDLLCEAASEAAKMCFQYDDCVNCPFQAPNGCLDGMKAELLIAKGVTIQKWIPVTERLPEDGNERVMVLVNKNSPYYPIGNQRIDTDRYRGKNGKWVRYGDTVTNWMPLPEPPKGE